MQKQDTDNVLGVQDANAEHEVLPEGIAAVDAHPPQQARGAVDSAAARDLLRRALVLIGEVLLTGTAENGGDLLPVSDLRPSRPPRGECPRLTLDDLVGSYRQLREEHGERARTVKGLGSLGHGWLYDRCKDRFTLNWAGLKALAGYHDPPAVAGRDPVAIITRVLTSPAVKGRLKCCDRRWMTDNGFSCLVGLAEKRLKSQWTHIVPEVLGVPSPQPHVEKAQASDPVHPDDSKGGSLRALIDEYREVVKQHGDEALSSTWLQRNGCGRVYYRARAHGISWSRFRGMCGLSACRKGLHGQTLDQLNEAYNGIRDRCGEDASSSSWMQRHGHGWVVSHAYKKHDLRWRQFKAVCGYPDGRYPPDVLNARSLKRPFDRIAERHGGKAWDPAWLESNGYSCLVPYVNGSSSSPPPSEPLPLSHEDETERLVSPLDEAMTLHADLIKRHGEKALRTKWLQDNGYFHIYLEVRRARLRWPIYTLELGRRKWPALPTLTPEEEDKRPHLGLGAQQPGSCQNEDTGRRLGDPAARDASGPMPVLPTKMSDTKEGISVSH